MNVSDETEARALEGLMRWYVAMGVDALVGETPHDRFVTPEPASDPPSAERKASVALRPAAGSAGPTSRTDPVPSADAQVREAEVLAAGADTLDELRTRWQTLPGCGLAATASRMLFSAGTPGAPLMLVAGAPEAEDERSGDAFSGPHGRLLDAMLRAIGRDRGNVYLANVVPWRPPGNRAPTPLELSLCLPFIRRQIALAQPEILLCLGERAAQPLLGSREPISRLRGRWLMFEGETATVKALVTFSPAYLMQQPLQKRRAWTDLLMLQESL